MPKQKPHKGLLKRIKITGRGKVRRQKAFRGHLMSGKSGARRQRLRRRGILTGRIGDSVRRAVAAG